jgi:hypothetical protein
MSVPNLDPDAGRPELNTGLVFMALFPMLDDDLIPIPVLRLDALLLADARGAFLLAHAVGMGLRGQQGSGADDRGSDRKAIEYQSHVLILSWGFTG